MGGEGGRLWLWTPRTGTWAAAQHEPMNFLPDLPEPAVFSSIALMGNWELMNITLGVRASWWNNQVRKSSIKKPIKKTLKEALLSRTTTSCHLLWLTCDSYQQYPCQWKKKEGWEVPYYIKVGFVCLASCFCLFVFVLPFFSVLSQALENPNSAVHEYVSSVLYNCLSGQLEDKNH